MVLHTTKNTYDKYDSCTNAHVNMHTYVAKVHYYNFVYLLYLAN